VGESGDRVTVEDGFTVRSLGVNESGWTVADCAIYPIRDYFRRKVQLGQSKVCYLAWRLHNWLTGSVPPGLIAAGIVSVVWLITMVFLEWMR